MKKGKYTMTNKIVLYLSGTVSRYVTIEFSLSTN